MDDSAHHDNTILAALIGGVSEDHRDRFVAEWQQFNQDHTMDKLLRAEAIRRSVAGDPTAPAWFAAATWCLENQQFGEITDAIEDDDGDQDNL